MDAVSSSNVFLVEDFIAMTIGILVYFVGRDLNGRIGFLRSYNIPEPVTGGVLASLVSLVIYLMFDLEIKYELETRDTLLIFFFTSIGINARLSDLLNGGKTLGVLLALTLGYIVLQDGIGILMARLIGQPDAMGILTGSAALIGGHGTAIAWAPEIAERFNLPNAMEIGVAAATLGLVMASLLGGPIAKILISRYGLSGDEERRPMVGLPVETRDEEQINHISLMRVIFTLHIAIILGYLLNEVIVAMGLKLPLFVACLLVAIVLSNTVPRFLPNIGWPARTRALAVVSDFSLGLFIAMSLMGMQLWSIVELAGPLLILLATQAFATIVFILFVLFPLMGRDYMAVVLSAGFAGFSLGATPTAIANMTAVTKSHGPAPVAFIILPLVGAFFVDITNAFVIQFFLSL